MSQNQLLHAMLRVPSVNATIDFWEERGATVHSYRKTPTAETAFVGFGPQQAGGWFSLEITKLADTQELGNAIHYIGLSMLLGMKNLMTAAAGETSSNVECDPNGIEVRSVASAPGDFLARVCLRADTSKEDVFSKTTDFYELLGMELMAADEHDICLRYTNTNDSIQRQGVATTLVFSKFSDNETLKMGNCLDHFAISTVDIQGAAAVLRESLEAPDETIFLEPTPMFDTQVMGLNDPSGYKVYLVQQQ